MDKLTAYKVLGLKSDCTLDEIKEAYASLSKQYHPEEEPEKFQEIHEAYVALTRQGRRSRTHSPVLEPTVDNKLSFDFKDTLEVEEKSEHIEQKIEYSFEEVIEKAEKDEAEKLRELVLEAGAELKVLVSPKYKNDLKAFKALFEDKKYEQIIRRADFLEKLCDQLEDSKLNKRIYNYIIDFYRLRGRQEKDLSQVGLRLYKILDGKVGMKQANNSSVFAGIMAGLVAGVQALRPLLREVDVLAFFGLAVLVIPCIVLGVKKLREKHSILLTQFIVALTVAISQIFVIIFDFYGTIFGSVENGNVVAVLIMMASLVWLAIILIIAVIRFVKRLMKK